MNRQERVLKALSHGRPDRTPLFEIFQTFHPIHWPICGRTLATEAALAWDALADGISRAEMIEASAQAQFKVARYFGLDMVRLNGAPALAGRPEKLGKKHWRLNGMDYGVNERTQMVELLNPGAAAGYSKRMDEDAVRRAIEAWDGLAPAPGAKDPLLARVQELAAADGVDWVYMAEIGCGTGVAFYPPFMLMWLLDETDLFQRWLAMQKASALPRTRQLIADGCAVVAMGGDVSCDKGPFISPPMYREFILPAIREHVDLIHAAGAKAVYTSDGNHWPIKEDYFFNSGVDGCKEVDKAAGMVWPRLIAEGVAERVCIIGNIDARHTMCHGTPAEVAAEARECLEYGLITRGGHIFHLSHSVHEDVKAENYITLITAYRNVFGLGPLPAAQ